MTKRRTDSRRNACGATSALQRSGLRGLVASLILGFLAQPALAQFLGEGAPGTPGAIEGELRGPRGQGLPPPPRATPIPPAPGTSRQSLQKRPNTAIRRSAGDTSRPSAANPLAPPANPQPRGLVSTSQRPGDLTGTRFRDAAPAGIPPVSSSVAEPAPGLPGVTPRQPRRLPLEQDPYAPLGIRSGGMVFRPALEVSGGYDTNPTRTATNRGGSALYRVETELRATSDWSQHQLDVDLRGSFTGYTSVRDTNRPEGDARAALRLDVSRDLTLDGEIRSRIDTENASNVNLPAGTTGRSPFYTNTASLGGTQRFGRLSLGLRGNVERTDYSDLEFGGVTTSQAARNLTGYGLRLRAGYEISPSVTPFVEVGADKRTYDETRDASGFERSSVGGTVRVGSTFELARTLIGEAAVGYTYRNYDDSRLSRLGSPTGDATLTWSISPLTTLALRAQTEIVETTLASSSGAIAYRGTATLTHAFLRHFTATTTFQIAETDYQRVNRRELQLIGGLRLEYKLNRMVAFRGSYAFEAYRLNAPNSNYQAHSFLLGMRFTP
ncbi:MAG: hypothetical protein CTY25_11435 [Methylobacterium sp.]|nr:MAG: hypothetical protein CTY25_11435 [Methylobacterium sp.]